jgi:hypothetical protein
MSEGTQGEGWWQASDGQWYPPEQHPDVQATAAMPAAPPPTAAPDVPPPGGPGAGSSNAKWIIVGVLAAVVVALAAFLLLGGDDKKQNVAANSSSAPSSSSSSSSKSSSSSSSSKSSSSSSSSSSSELSETEIESRLIKAKDLGPGFSDGTFETNDSEPTSCGGPSVNSQVPAKSRIGGNASDGVAFFEEQVLVYATSDEAKKALEVAKASVSCPEPTTPGGGAASFGPPEDVSSDIDAPVDDAIRIALQTEEAEGSLFATRFGNVIVSFQFVAQKTADPSELPDELAIVNKGLSRLAA